MGDNNAQEGGELPGGGNGQDAEQDAGQSSGETFHREPIIADDVLLAELEHQLSVRRQEARGFMNLTPRNEGPTKFASASSFFRAVTNAVKSHVQLKDDIIAEATEKLASLAVEEKTSLNVMVDNWPSLQPHVVELKKRFIRKVNELDNSNVVSIDVALEVGLIPGMESEIEIGVEAMLVDDDGQARNETHPILTGSEAQENVPHDPQEEEQRETAEQLPAVQPPVERMEVVEEESKKDKKDKKRKKPVAEETSKKAKVEKQEVASNVVDKEASTVPASSDETSLSTTFSYFDPWFDFCFNVNNPSGNIIIGDMSYFYEALTSKKLNPLRMCKFGLVTVYTVGHSYLPKELTLIAMSEIKKGYPLGVLNLKRYATTFEQNQKLGKRGGEAVILNLLSKERPMRNVYFKDNNALFVLDPDEPTALGFATRQFKTPNCKVETVKNETSQKTLFGLVALRDINKYDIISYVQSDLDVSYVAPFENIGPSGTEVSLGKISKFLKQAKSFDWDEVWPTYQEEQKPESVKKAREQFANKACQI